MMGKLGKATQKSPCLTSGATSLKKRDLKIHPHQVPRKDNTEKLSAEQGWETQDCNHIQGHDHATITCMTGAHPLKYATYLQNHMGVWGNWVPSTSWTAWQITGAGYARGTSPREQTDRSSFLIGVPSACHCSLRVANSGEGTEPPACLSATSTHRGQALCRSLGGPPQQPQAALFLRDL